MQNNGFFGALEFINEFEKSMIRFLTHNRGLHQNVEDLQIFWVITLQRAEGPNVCTMSSLALHCSFHLPEIQHVRAKDPLPSCRSNTLQGESSRPSALQFM
ncbi:hypothetical protein O6H91_15G007800 [Diphasiastrum complanatum]|uniref:Uncharacterized protein n=1 Tax=Diphasiastrum complanatum TaxID=34168 RepID=A0ACC2BGI6_DIPCM|nr:hypothetical protein O6H91_15G007800 [Diphasiastrum complanatum]